MIIAGTDSKKVKKTTTLFAIVAGLVLMPEEGIFDSLELLTIQWAIIQY